MKDCGHPYRTRTDPAPMVGDTAQCRTCGCRLRFDGTLWLTDVVVLKVERELVEAVHREIVDDSTFNEALRTILVERGAMEERP